MEKVRVCSVCGKESKGPKGRFCPFCGSEFKEKSSPKRQKRKEEDRKELQWHYLSLREKVKEIEEQIFELKAKIEKKENEIVEKLIKEAEERALKEIPDKIMKEFSERVKLLEAKVKDNTEFINKMQSSCFIATCIYGPSSKEVQVLRRFRDIHLTGNLLGKTFLRIYYGCSPFMIGLLGRSPFLQSQVKWGLDRLVNFVERR